MLLNLINNQNTTPKLLHPIFISLFLLISFLFSLFPKLLLVPSFPSSPILSFLFFFFLHFPTYSSAKPKHTHTHSFLWAWIEDQTRSNLPSPSFSLSLSFFPSLNLCFGVTRLIFEQGQREKKEVALRWSKLDKRV